MSASNAATEDNAMLRTLCRLVVGRGTRMRVLGSGRATGCCGGRPGMASCTAPDHESNDRKCGAWQRCGMCVITNVT
jgi:hypothetical protein